MKIVKETTKHDCYYDNAVSGMPTLKVVDIDDDSVTVDFNAIIATQFAGGNVPEKYGELNRFLGLGEFSSAPDGGFINYYSVFSRKLKRYILFSGVNEVNNSHYIVTVYKFIMI